eukprot:XP_011420119.1 PREDICTED: uncharacterized protein LOC105322914 [Crassostrea gigas]
MLLQYCCNNAIMCCQKFNILVRVVYELSYHFNLFNQYIKSRETRHGRHFFINKKYHGCPGDEGWLVVADSIGSKPCQWEKQKTYPQFLYAKQGKSTIWNNMKFGRADVLNIYIQR